MSRKFTPPTLAWLNEGTLASLRPSSPLQRLKPPSASWHPLRAAAQECLDEHYRRRTTRYGLALGAFAELHATLPEVEYVEQLTKAKLRLWVNRMEAKGNRSTTISTKLSVVGVLCRYLDIEPCPLPPISRDKNLKFWLTPDAHKRADTWLRGNGFNDLADYIDWATRTGLRIEESLRVQRHHFSGLETGRPSLTVPGTKTSAAQATLPLFKEATLVAVKRFGGVDGPLDQFLFPAPPRVKLGWLAGKKHPSADDDIKRGWALLRAQWNECRAAIGLKNTHGATLKSFRRTFAWYATEKGIPTIFIQRYLRHEQIATTEGYLKLTGSFSTESMRKWFY